MPFDDSDDLLSMFDNDDFAFTATLNGTAWGNVLEDTEYLLALGMLSTTERGVIAIGSVYGAAVLGGTLVYNSGTHVIRARQALPPDGKVVMLKLEKQ